METVAMTKNGIPNIGTEKSKRIDANDNRRRENSKNEKIKFQKKNDKVVDELLPHKENIWIRICSNVDNNQRSLNKQKINRSKTNRRMRKNERSYEQTNERTIENK